MLYGDLKPEPQNQLELKVNAFIHLTTKANASLEITRGIYSFSMVIDSFSFFWFENGIIISQKQNSVKNCWEKQQKLANFMKKRYFKSKLTHSKRFDRVTDEVMSLFWSWNKLSGKTLLSRKFSLPCDKRLTLYCPRPNLPTFSLILITPLNFKCRTSTGYV